ncbi:MAG: hypothetical protein ACOZAA_07700 [Pseudomonadota bacterium]
MIANFATARAMLAAVVVGFCMPSFAQISPRDVPLDAITREPFFFSRCDVAGAACCEPDSEVKTNHCHKGLGCDISTNTCSACGGDGQPCCDGDFTGFSGRGYTGVLRDPKERIESCNKGFSCDARLATDGVSWIGSRVCRACGTKEGGACCPPDVRYGVGRCTADPTLIGSRLTCDDPYKGDRGTCVACGSEGQPACAEGQRCFGTSVEIDGVCRPCGRVGQPTCENGSPCEAMSAPKPITGEICVPAGRQGQICLPGKFCDFDLVCNASNICESCGGWMQACCAAPQQPCGEGPCTNGKCLTKPRTLVCKEYADRAVAQSREYLTRQCDEADDRWQTNYENHYNWCMDMDPDTTIMDRETSIREGMLARCQTYPVPGAKPPPGEVCAVTAMLLIEECLNLDGSPSQYLDPNSISIPGCGSDEDRAVERAKLNASAYNPVDEPAPGACTYSVSVEPGCGCL